MKKYTVLLLAMIALALSACKQQNEPPPIIEMLETTSSATETTIPLITPDQLPIPDEIKLRNESIMWENDSKYRSVYYGMSGAIGELGEYFPFHDKSDEMEMANYLKANSVKKEDFIAAVQKNYEHSVEMGWDIYAEGGELPNADIIYTFDNEIINAYYRRENPVAPEPGTYTTYGSYEEYLKANR